ncbi:MAG: Vps62-related protein [Pyrinomonadaceae bacterium]|nr:Vps62-related protein [Pyrinomonadaceae bacterium]
MLEKFAPVVYLNSAETSLPSSAEWYLQRTKLVDASGNVISNPASANISALGLAQSDYRLEMIDQTSRSGQGVDAPVYGFVRSLGDPVTAIDLTYWFFYPFKRECVR